MPRDISIAQSEPSVADAAAQTFIHRFAVTYTLNSRSRTALQGMIDLSRKENCPLAPSDHEAYRTQCMKHLRLALGAKGSKQVRDDLVQLDSSLRALEQPFTLPRPLPRWLTP